MNCVVDAYESHDIMTSDVPNAFIQTDAPEIEIGERVIMKIREKLVDWLVDLDPGEYENLVVIENHQKSYLPFDTKVDLWHARSFAPVV